jgi:tetratricopeptide (TPR) repeat protein
MANLKLVMVAAVAVCAGPAAASVMVVGSSDARMCYEAADSPLNPSVRDIRRCDGALLHDTLSQYEIVATHVNRGILWLRRGMVDEAIGDFDEAMRLDPQQPEAYLNKGAALLQGQNPSEAAQLFTVALDRRTSRPAIAHYGRAIANEQLGNVREAYEDYQAASLLAPDWADPRTELQRFRVVQR